MIKLKLFETHAHYNDEVFEKDREEIIKNMLKGQRIKEKTRMVIYVKNIA